jgi:DNA-binding transcriptional LysR family regulator
MELRQLRHFVVLAEEMHFGRAAKRLFMTQPALSTSIMRFEEVMKARLFDRSNKTVALSPIGKGLLARAREIVFLSEKLEEFGHAMAAGSAGFLQVGFTGTLFFRNLDQILDLFAALYPDIELSLREMSSQGQVDMLREGRLDAAFINSPVPPAGLDSLVFFEEKFVACLPAGHRLAKKRLLDVRELAHESFVMLSRDPSPPYHDHVVGLCAAAGFQPKVHFAAAQVLTIVAIVASGHGVSLVPESVSKAGIDGLVYIPLRNVERLPSAYLAWNPYRDVPGLRGLIDTVRNARRR